MEDVRKRFAEYKRLRQVERPCSTEDTDGVREDRLETRDAAAPRDAEPTHTEGDKDDGKSATKSVSDAHQPPPARSDAPLSVPLYVTVLKALLWLLLWGFFVEVGFGAVYFITSLLYFIIVSLRGSRRRSWEPSAYSVFNKNFETIEGTLSAEQFERELRYGPMSVKK